MDADSELLISSLYDGIMTPEGWQPALAMLRSLTNSEQTTLLIWNRTTDDILVGEAYGADPDQLRRYERDFARHDPNKINSDKIPLLGWYYDVRELGADFLRKNDFYQTFMRENGLGGVMYSPLLREGNIVAALSFQRPMSRSATSLRDAECIACYMPHVQRAMRLRWKYQELQLLGQMSQSVLDRIGVPVFVVDAQGKTLVANRLGVQWLSTQGKSVCTRAQSRNAPARCGMEQIAKVICSTRRTAVPHGMCLKGIDGSDQGYMVGIPLPPSNPITSHWRGRTGLVFIHGRQASSTSTPQIMRCLFGLTGAECKVASLLHQGLSLSEIAETSCVAKETVRGQLKAVFSKTGVSRQSELISLIQGLARFEHEQMNDRNG